MGTRSESRVVEIKFCDICGEDFESSPRGGWRHEDPDVDIHESCYNDLPDWMKTLNLSYLLQATAESNATFEAFCYDEDVLEGWYWVFLYGEDDRTQIARFGSLSCLEEFVACEMDPGTSIVGCYHEHRFHKVAIQTRVVLSPVSSQSGRRKEP